ncbi:MAG: ATP-binding cassette domain-containing protein, partial [Erysipelotrichia bacterium]|nr:ATP-binding cassette domain-containing protein [Erysipelotrichia bacterium]
GKPFIPADYHIGYMPEERGMYPKKKVIDQLIYFAQLKGFSKAEAKASGLHLLEKLAILDYANRKMETLSKGNQQKVQLAQTLICSPDIIILDEPFSGLDPVNSQLLKDLILEEIAKGKLVIFSSHQMSYVEEFCEDIVILNRGEIVLSGNLKEIQKQYGKQKGILSVNQYSCEALAQYCTKHLQAYLQVEQMKKEYIVFTYKKSKQECMEVFTNEKLDVALFGDYKPSLTDIFVKEAGE